MFRSRPVRRALLAAAALSLAPLAVAASATANAATAASPVTDPASLVNPLIGTSGQVDDFPGADVPFGMVQWSPDTTPDRPEGGGYEYDDSAVSGFSLTHISGPGCGAAGDIPILPITGAVPADPDSATLPLNHSQEKATAGEYTLTGDGITTQLTTTTHSGMGRFTFPTGAPASLLLKLSDSQNGTDSTHFQVINNHEVDGWITSGHFCGASDEYTLHFDMTFDHSFTSTGTYSNDAVQAGNKSLAVNGQHTPPTSDRGRRSSNGVVRQSPTLHGSSSSVSPNVQPPVVDASGAYLTFDTSKSNVVQAKVGISYVSTDNATQNRTSENPGWNFATTAAAAHAAWNKQLGAIAISGGTPTQQTIFYTALYHALLHPNVYSDVNGQYEGYDGETHTAPTGHSEYANFSGWDIYRTQAQLEAMIDPSAANDEVRSMLDEYDQTGQLPKWELNNGETYVMVGDPADSIIADAYAFGAHGFDTKAALSDMLTEANQPNNIRPGLSTYLSQGYLPLDDSYGCCNFYGPVSTQQEYNVADHSISAFASALGDTSDAATFAARGNSWQNVFNPASGFLQPKDASGQFAPNFSPGSSTGFVEGDSYQYTPMEPQDIAGAIAADGGAAAWNAKLDGLTSNISDPGPANADFGNEPSIEIPWEYDYTGAPYKTQASVRQIQQQIYTDQPAGIAGNDDLGTMSAWYVWSALGFYPETPGSATLVLGSPVFPKAVITLASGKKLTVTGAGAATGNPYVQSMTVNGASWSHAYLNPSIISQGGTVAFTLGSTPNTSWGSTAADAPPSDMSGLDPALGYTSQPNVIVAPGKSASLTIGARSLAVGAQTVTWKAVKTSGGPSVSPSSGTLYVKPGADGTQAITVTAPSNEGRYTLTFTMVGANGISLPNVVVEVDVAKPGELWPYYSNAGISSDGASDQGDYDGDGYSYSSQALAAAGVSAGGTVTADGVSYTFPDIAPGSDDNIIAGGQTIPLATPVAATRIGILGSATNASGGAQGTFVLHFTDGTSQSVQLGLSDWTLGAGTTTVQYGNTTVATTSYRDTANGSKQQVTTYLFAADTAISGGKKVASVTFPSTVTDGQLHVFAFTVK